MRSSSDGTGRPSGIGYLTATFRRDAPSGWCPRGATGLRTVRRWHSQFESANTLANRGAECQPVRECSGRVWRSVWRARLHASTLVPGKNQRTQLPQMVAELDLRENRIRLFRPPWSPWGSDFALPGCLHGPLILGREPRGGPGGALRIWNVQRPNGRMAGHAAVGWNATRTTRRTSGPAGGRMDRRPDQSRTDGHLVRPLERPTFQGPAPPEARLPRQPQPADDPAFVRPKTGSSSCCANRKKPCWSGPTWCR